MAEDNIVQKIKRLKPMSKRPIGRPKTRWEDDVLDGIKSINVRNWKKVVQNKDRKKKKKKKEEEEEEEEEKNKKEKKKRRTPRFNKL